MPRTKFTEEIDNCILVQCRADTPFRANYGHSEDNWQLVCQHLEIGGIRLTQRAVRDRFLLLIREFKKKDLINRKKTGSAEILTEIDKVCYEIVQMMEDLKKNKKVEKKLEITKVREELISNYKKMLLEGKIK